MPLPKGYKLGPRPQSVKDKIGAKNKGKEPWSKGKTKDMCNGLKKMSEKMKQAWKDGKMKPHEPWNKGLTKETDERVKKNVEATRKTAKKNREIPGFIHHNKGRKFPPQSEETKRKRKESLRKRLDTPGYVSPKKGKKVSEIAKINIAKGKLKRWSEFSKPTIPEQKVKFLLEKFGINFDFQKIVSEKIFDFYLTDFNILIEVDGAYWHAKDTVDEQLNKTQKYNRKNDRYKDRLARECGYNLIRVWEDEIDKLEEYIQIMIMPLILVAINNKVAGEQPKILNV